MYMHVAMMLQLHTKIKQLRQRQLVPKYSNYTSQLPYNIGQKRIQLVLQPLSSSQQTQHARLALPDPLHACSYALIHLLII